MDRKDIDIMGIVIGQYEGSGYNGGGSMNYTKVSCVVDIFDKPVPDGASLDIGLASEYPDLRYATIREDGFENDAVELKLNLDKFARHIKSIGRDDCCKLAFDSDDKTQNADENITT